MSEYIVEQNPYPTFTIDGFNVRCDDWLIQREEIVRCRDCKWCMAYMSGTYCDYMSHAIELDGFCAWGEKKGNLKNGI